MPNWCSNQLTVRGPDEDVKRFKKQAIGHSPWETPEERGDDPPEPLNFHSLVPIPEEVLKSGYEDIGYHWELKNWGVKWGACHTAIADEWDEYVIYMFDTAWAPPIAFIENVSKQWTALIFILDYEERGEGFKGIAKGHAGEVEDHCITF